jgi:hypothetical protein
MLSGQGDSAPFPVTESRGRRFSKTGWLALLGIAVFGGLLYLWLRPPARSVEFTVNPGAAAHGRSHGITKVDARPLLELEKVVPYGRSLELIGHVEPGSRLVVNDEKVEVEGDGSFRHFTKLFPPSSGRVRIVLTAIDLAGRTRILTAVHDFGSGGESN